MFYTPSRYAFKLSASAHGDGSGEGTHLSVFLHLQRGDYDAHVEWPCHKSYKFTLVAPSDSKAADVTHTIHFSNTTNADHNGRNATLGWGKPKFIANTALSGYLRDDSLVFTIPCNISTMQV